MAPHRKTKTIKGPTGEPLVVPVDATAEEIQDAWFMQIWQFAVEMPPSEGEQPVDESKSI